MKRVDRPVTVDVRLIAFPPILGEGCLHVLEEPDGSHPREELVARQARNVFRAGPIESAEETAAPAEPQRESQNVGHAVAPAVRRGHIERIWRTA